MVSGLGWGYYLGYYEVGWGWTVRGDVGIVFDDGDLNLRFEGDYWDGGGGMLDSYYSNTFAIVPFFITPFNTLPSSLFSSIITPLLD